MLDLTWGQETPRFVALAPDQLHCPAALRDLQLSDRELTRRPCNSDLAA